MCFFLQQKCESIVLSVGLPLCSSVYDAVDEDVQTYLC